MYPGLLFVMVGTALLTSTYDVWGIVAVCVGIAIVMLTCEDRKRSGE